MGRPRDDDLFVSWDDQHVNFGTQGADAGSMSVVCVRVDLHTHPEQMIAYETTHEGRILADPSGKDEGVEPANGGGKPGQFTCCTITE